jgi:hypothetical protein
MALNVTRRAKWDPWLDGTSVKDFPNARGGKYSRAASDVDPTNTVAAHVMQTGLPPRIAPYHLADKIQPSVCLRDRH